MARKLLLLASPLEIPSNYDVYYMRSIDPVIGLLVSGPVPALPFALLLLLLPQVLTAGRPDRQQVLLSLWILAILAGVAMFFVTYRFRLPAVPFIILLTASRLDGRRLRLPQLAAGAALAAGLGLATSGWERRAGVNLPFHDAVAHFEEGREEEAEALFLVSLERAGERPDLNMNRVEAMYDLGVLAARRGDTDRAEGWWRAALEAAPGWDAPRRALGTLVRAPGMEP
jgi:tetratricopeptide (TPR) repeat protein